MYFSVDVSKYISIARYENDVNFFVECYFFSLQFKAENNFLGGNNFKCKSVNHASILPEITFNDSRNICFNLLY